MLLLFLGIALTFPVVQTKIAHYFTEKLNKQYGTNIYVEQVEVNVFGGVQLKKVMIKDEKNDTLVYSDRIITTILDSKKLLDGNLIFGNMKADGLLLKIKTYKGYKDSNLDKFVAAFDDGKKSSGKFLMTSKKITLVNCRFIEIDYNRDEPLDVDFTKLNAVVSNFIVKGPNVSTHIDQMSFQDHRGLFIENIESQFTYTKQNIRLEKLDLKTKESSFNGDVILKYDRKDFADFNNKVIFDINTNAASIASNDIRYFYDGLGKNQQFELSGKIDGTLNNLKAKNLHLKDLKNSEIIGNVNFKNLFARKGEGDFYMKGSFDKVASSYDNLSALLPDVLGKKLPSSLKKLGQFNLVGDAEITTKTIDADFKLQTKLGNVASKLVMTNIDNIDNATYSGKIVLENFDLGTFLNRKDLGKTSLDIDVDGKGFTEKLINTSFSGEIKNFKYNGYNYKNIIANGSFKKPIFKGKLNINDPNLFIDFDGIVNLSKNENIYNFKAKVDYINLKALNFVNEPISIFKGDVVMNVTGNNLENIRGDIFLKNASYQNAKDTYFFDDLKFNSSFNPDKTRKIALVSTDGIEGEVEGKFDFNQIPKMIQNSLGSLYTNYKPNLIKKGQYLKFNFREFNKIIEIINPKVTFSKDAILNGNINSDENEFKLNFTSNTINAFDVELDKVQLEINNKNPLYNTYIQVDSIKNKYYKVRDFSLINVTSQDTLNFRTEFKGGKNGNDFYNLNAYHTIDENNNNVVGFKKSDLMFKDFLWNINANEIENNRIIFDKKLTNFNFENLVFSHENQTIKLEGLLAGKDNKDIQLTFNNVNLNKITPDVKKFKFDGFVNGKINIKQTNSVYQPTSSLIINDLLVNENELGNLKLDVEGDENFRKFNINSLIENDNFESFKSTGGIEIVNDETIIDLNLNFKKFNLSILSNLGAGVLSNIRGFASGNAHLGGNVKNIEYYGRLYVDDTGLTIPYLNVDYLIKPNSIIDVTQNKFIIQKTEITDTKYKTNGYLYGFIKHKQFGNWELNLNIDTKRLLALDTKDSEDAAYYGTAYIDGNATIIGPTEALVINVNAKSQKGTFIKIPINDAESIEEKQYIHFITAAEKYNLNNTIAQQTISYNGLELNFDFDITEDAEIEVILNRESGHGMKGSGRGGLLFQINTLGKFEMYGDFQVYKGYYNFKYGGIIDKKLDVKKFSSISWEGDPLKAILDLEAVYNTSANPSILVDNATLNKKIPVEVGIVVKGNLTNPEPDFNIRFPNLSSVLKSEVQTKLDDDDTRQKQALYLLSTGSFLSPEGLSVQQSTNFAFEKASVLFNDLFNNTDDKLQLGIGYIQADKNGANYEKTDGRFEATVTSKINDRITINGRVGVPIGGVTETAIVGNIEVEYRVNDDGTLNLRVFNREADISYIGQGINYTQGLGISYEVDFDTFKELINKMFKKHNKNKDIEAINSSVNKLSNDTENNGNQPTDAPKANQDAIPVKKE